MPKNCGKSKPAKPELGHPCAFLFSELKHEVRWKTLNITLDLSIEPLYFDAIHCGQVTKSFLDSTRRMVEAWLGYGWSGCWMVGEMVV